MEDDDAIAEEIIGRLIGLAHRMEEHFHQATTGLGLSAPEGHALHRLESPAPMRAMAAALGCDASYVTLLTDRLERAGLVERRPDPADRRVRNLALTETGRATRERLVATIHATSPALANLDAGDRLRFLALLRKLGPTRPPAC
jgi:DNA-binding MarR family transcriptional regulator